MPASAFDALEYFEKLKEAGVPEQQAKIQANALRDAFTDSLVTRNYLDARLKDLELRLLKWQIGIAIALCLVMAKGFGWIGF